MKSGNLNFLEPSGPLQACKGTALPFYIIGQYTAINTLITKIKRKYSQLHGGFGLTKLHKCFVTKYIQNNCSASEIKNLWSYKYSYYTYKLKIKKVPWKYTNYTGIVNNKV
jgi:hypothetical protein